LGGFPPAGPCLYYHGQDNPDLSGGIRLPLGGSQISRAKCL
jgi:hypothetical protein